MSTNPQVILGAMLSELADQIALGRWGDVNRCVVLIRGEQSKAIITYPKEPVEATAAELNRAMAWLVDELLPAPGGVH